MNFYNDIKTHNSLTHYKKNFDKLQAIVYQDIVVNGVCIRNLGIQYMEITPEWSVKNHKHSFFEFHYVSEGYGLTTTHHLERRVNAGSFYLMPPGTTHSHRQDPETGHIGFALRFECKKADSKSEFRGSANELEKMGELLWNASTVPNQDSGKIIHNMIDLLELADSEVWILPLQMAFCRLLFNIADFYNQDQSLPKLPVVNQSFLENQIIRSALNFIEENYSQEMDVEDIAHSIHLSYSHLSRLFKSHTGETLINHLNKVRLNKAQMLLKCSDKTIAQIAREVGIGNEQYFCTVFKKDFGITPGNFRNNGEQLLE